MTLIWRENLRTIVSGILIVLIGIFGCKSDDEKARILHNQAITANREGRNEEALKLLQKIVSKYPSTQTAVEANKALAAGEAFSAAVGSAKMEIRKKRSKRPLNSITSITAVTPPPNKGSWP